jgi:hypothetical protein
MTAGEWASIIVSLLSIAVSVLAMVFAFLFYKESRSAAEQASTTLVEVKTAAESVKHEVQDIVTSLLTSVLHQGDGESWRSEMCCLNSDVMRRERMVRKSGTIYVSVVTMDYEVSQFVQVIADNLKQGKQYVYFLPDDIPGGCDVQTQKFINALTDVTGIPEDLLKSNLRILKVPSGEILCNVTLFDPGFGPDEGYILPAYENAERAFSVRLDHILHDRAYNRVREWLARATPTVLWPPASSGQKRLNE